MARSFDSCRGARLGFHSHRRELKSGLRHFLLQKRSTEGRQVLATLPPEAWQEACSDRDTGNGDRSLLCQGNKECCSSVCSPEMITGKVPTEAKEVVDATSGVTVVTVPMATRGS